MGTRRGAFDVVDVADGAFDYNDRVMVEVSQKESRDFWIRPTGGVVNQRGPFYFTIEPMADRYLQLNRAGLEMSFRVTKADGTACDIYKDIVAPINLLGACFFKTVEISLNDQPFNSASSVNAGLKAYLETLLSYDSDSRNTHLHSQFFHLDSPLQFDNCKVSSTVVKLGFIREIKSGGIARPDIPPELELTQAEQALVSEIDDEDAILHSALDEDKEFDRTTVLGRAQAKKWERMLLYQKHFNDRVGDLIRDWTDDNVNNLNRGYMARFEITCGSHSFDTYAPLTHDFCKINNHLGPGNRVDIKLDRYPDEFLLNSSLVGEGYKLVLDDLKLHLHTIERRENIPSPSIERYLMNETQMHRQVVNSYLQEANFRIHHGGVMPKTVLVTMQLTQASDGAYRHNPWLFHHFHASEAHLVVNGEKVPSGGLQFDFTKSNPKVAHAYHWLFENTGAWNPEKGNIVSWNAFQNGSFILAFDLTPDRCNGAHNHEAVRGYIDLFIKFSVPLPAPIYVCYEMVYPKVVVNNKLEGRVYTLDIDSAV